VRGTGAKKYSWELEGVVMSLQRLLGTPPHTFHVPHQVFLKEAETEID
jgi:hypothetical protein